MSNFTEGMRIGQSAVLNGQQMARQARLDEQNDWRFQQEQEAARRAAGTRADLAYLADGGDTGITPNMTRTGDGMGPVYSPKDVDAAYKGGGGLQMPADSGAPAATAAAAPTAMAPVEGVDTASAPAPAGGLSAPGPAPAAAPANTRMSDADIEGGLGKIALRNGDVAGYRTSRASAKALKFEQGYEDYGKKLASMSNEDLMVEAKKYVNDNAKAPGTIGYDPKTRMYTMVHDSGAAQQIDPMQARGYLLAAYKMGNGKVEDGINAMMDLNRAKKNDQRADTAAENATAASVGHLNQGVQQVDIARARLGLAGAAEARAAKNDKRGNMVTMVDKKTNEPVVGWLNSDGKFTKADLPEGLTLPRNSERDLSPKEVATEAGKLVASGVPNPETKKPYTMQEAAVAVRAAADPKNTGGSGVEVDLTKLQEALQAGRKGAGPGGAGPSTPGLPQRIPAPPPEYGFNGNARVRNPGYDAWLARYGDAYQAQQDADTEASAANRSRAQAAVEASRNAPPMRLGY